MLGFIKPRQYSRRLRPLAASGSIDDRLRGIASFALLASEQIHSRILLRTYETEHLVAPYGRRHLFAIWSVSLAVMSQSRIRPLSSSSVGLYFGLPCRFRSSRGSFSRS